MAKPLILIVDDGRDILDYCQLFLKDEFEFLYETNGRDALERLKTSSFNLILLDKNFIGTPKEKLFFPQDPTNEGLYILPELVKRYPAIPVVMVTSYADFDSAKKALKLKASDYIEWGILGADALFLKHRLEKTIAFATAGKDNIKNTYNGFGIVGKSPKMLELFESLERASGSDATVMISGESGVGKDLVARALHRNSARRDYPFTKISCANIPTELLESELLGHEKGAFTGAVAQRIGRLEYADKGTVFLDEISEMNLVLQAKFLRFVEEKSFERIGSNKTIRVDVRIIAASNKDLKKAIAEKQFRDDLFWRLNVVSIRVPPLRERREDIALLIDHFIAKYAGAYHADIAGISREAAEYLSNYDFEENNVRELENTIASSIHFADRMVTLKDILRTKDIGPTAPRFVNCAYDSGMECPLMKGATLEEMENKIIRRRLEEKRGNVRAAAQSLGISKTKLYEKLQEVKSMKD